jgi:hypothetical protein
MSKGEPKYKRIQIYPTPVAFKCVKALADLEGTRPSLLAKKIISNFCEQLPAIKKERLIKHYNENLS